jgi:hypothetical protein
MKSNSKRNWLARAGHPPVFFEGTTILKLAALAYRQG